MALTFLAALKGEGALEKAAAALVGGSGKEEEDGGGREVEEEEEGGGSSSTLARSWRLQGGGGGGEAGWPAASAGVVVVVVSCTEVCRASLAARAPREKLPPHTLLSAQHNWSFTFSCAASNRPRSSRVDRILIEARSGGKVGGVNVSEVMSFPSKL